MRSLRPAFFCPVVFSALSMRLLSLLLLTVAGVPCVQALNRKNAGPDEVELKFHLPPPAPLDAAAALKSFTVEPGYRLELVASEPMVEAPIAIVGMIRDGFMWWRCGPTWRT